MDNNKLNILFDATVLVDGELGFSKRTGFFFVALRLLESFLKREDIHVILMSKPAKMAGVNRVVEKYFHQEIDVLYKSGFLSKPSLLILTKLSKLRNRWFKTPYIRKMFSGFCLIMESFSEFVLFFRNPVRINKNIIYFSPQTNAPLYIERKKQLKKFTILHDCIPLKLLEYKNQINPKWPSYFANSDYYFFSNSKNTLNDFCEFYDVAKSHVFLSYLAASEEFFPIKKKTQLMTTKAKYHLPEGKKYIFSLCTLEPRKNLIRAVKNFIHFAKKNTITDMIFAIGGPSWHDFENRLKDDEDIKRLCYK